MKLDLSLSRRDFLKLSGMGVGSLALAPWLRRMPQLTDFPSGDHLGRICQLDWYWPIEIKSRPDANSSAIRTLKEDDVIVWNQEVVGSQINMYHPNRRWLETPEGYVWSPTVQPVQNTPNPDTGQWALANIGEGFWAEVTVPYVEATLERPEPVAYWLRYRLDHYLPVRFFYNEILWIDDVRQGDDGQIQLRINEKYGNPGDIFWADAQAFRPIQADEITPINPDAEGKSITVDLTQQELSCYEGQREVYYCRTATGVVLPGTEPSDYPTPLGPHPVWRKCMGIQMSGGSAETGWDLPGIGWATFFYSNGQAIHSTYWHNNFGEVMSRGCVNVAPDDAKWIFRWSLPAVDYSPGERTISGYNGTTLVTVIQT